MKKILVVDDDRTIHMVLSAALESEYEISSALDAMQGLKLAKQLKPDLVILDLHMPAGGGGSVFSSLRMMTDTFQTPILIYSAATIEEVLAKVPGVGPEHVLLKPSSLADLREAVHRLLPP
jgi:CheY-like chemotaxis protein